MFGRPASCYLQATIKTRSRLLQASCGWFGVDAFQLSERWHDRCVVVTCAGELDLATVDALTDALDRVRRSDPTPVVIDLSAVTYLGSTGLNELVRAYKCLGRSRLRVVTARPETLRLLRITGLDEVLVVLPTLNEAMTV